MTILSDMRILRTITVVTAILIGPFFQREIRSEELRPVSWLTGESFRRELEKPFSASWSREELRTMLTQVSTDRRIACVLDRRLDSSAEFPVNVTNVPLDGGLTKIAQLVDADLSLPENVVYLGPKSAARRLRTLIELRRLELQAEETKIPERRRAELQRRRTIEWHDLDTPREILNKISNESRLPISNDTIIPHDLWVTTILPEVTLPEALSLVLIQFDLTFRWRESGMSIELIPIPTSVSLERRYHPKQNLTESLALIHQRFPELDAKVSNSEIIVRGFLEDHEAVSSLISGVASKRPVRIDPLQPVAKRRFTFSANQRVPIIAVMKKLEESDIRFEYDRDELKAAGIDLEQTIELDAKNKPASEFFQDLLGPAGLEFQFDRTTVKLKPQKATAPQK